MTLRAYRPADCGELIRLFCDTVHAVNARDYTEEQCNAWAECADERAWNASLSAHDTLVAEEEGKIVGFADLADGNYLDRLYVSKDYQRRGVATALCDILESRASGEITVCASVTAKTFFEKRGYRTVQRQQMVRGGVSLTNFVMKKRV